MLNTSLIMKEDHYKTICNLAEIISDTLFVPKEFRGKKNEIFAVIIYGMEIGISPMQALQNISIINDKPNIYGDLSLALISGHKDFEDMKEYFKDENETIAVCKIKRKNRELIIREFSIQDAKKANLLGRPIWQTYTKRMLQMRARGFALRDSFPDVLKGLITREEATDYEPINESINNNINNHIPTIDTNKPEVEDSEQIKKLIQEICDKYELNDRLNEHIYQKFGKENLEDLTYDECERVYKKLSSVIFKNNIEEQ